jgi:hypothetical protein
MGMAHIRAEMANVQSAREVVEMLLNMNQQKICIEKCCTIGGMNAIRYEEIG